MIREERQPDHTRDWLEGIANFLALLVLLVFLFGFAGTKEEPL
jgi:hypothetical protein